MSDIPGDFWTDLIGILQKLLTNLGDFLNLEDLKFFLCFLRKKGILINVQKLPKMLNS